VERCAADPEELVRLAAVSDARMPAATAVLLLDDPCDGVRHRAAAHPSLPVRVLARLLGDHRTAEAAVRNPQMPADVLRRMVGLAGLISGPARA
jgi:hypothetical protein